MITRLSYSAYCTFIMTTWTVQLPMALTPPTSKFFLKIGGGFNLLIGGLNKLLIQPPSGGGYVVVWTKQNLGQ